MPTLRPRTIHKVRDTMQALAEQIAELNTNASNDYVAKVARAFLLMPANAPAPAADASRLEQLVWQGYQMALSNPKAWEVFTKRICGDYRRAPDAEDVNRAYKYVYDKVTPASDATNTASEPAPELASADEGTIGAAGGMAHTTD